jgi:hypothetical protein
VQVDLAALPLDLADLALAVLLVLAGLTVDDPRDLDEADGGSQHGQAG